MAEKTGGSVLALLVPVLVLTLVAAGGGVLVAKQVLAAAKSQASGEPVAKKPAAPEAPSAAATSATKELPPILTNLSAPDGAVVRLQAAIVYNKSDVQQADLLAARIGDDTLAYMKSLTLAQLQGSEGLQHLREDLGERAAMRSDGRVREVLIETLVVQ